jgi:tetratricopeptide (TPR) repeat protein
VAALTVGEPLLLLCQLRPDRKAPSWGLVDRLQASLGSVFERIDLEPLSSAEADTLLANLLPVRDLPDAVRRQILERSEGNPFYLEEVLRTLIDCGQVVRDDGHWRATRTIVDAQIPQTLAGVLSARIDRLPEATKRVAQTAAVIGRVFTLSVLEHVCHASPPPERVEHIEPHIATLSYEQVVRERMREPEREYIFKHALTCEAAYGLLLRARRRELHARCGAALEVVFAQRRDEFAPMLAYHYGEAEELPRAIDYARRAALNARKLYALREELGHRERILGWLERMADAMPGERIDAVLEWTLVRHKLNEYDGVLERLTQAVAMARASGDKHRLAHALSWAGNIHVVTGFPSRAFPYIEESRRLAAEVGDEQLLLLPLFVATLSLVDRDPAASVQALHDVIDQARAQGVNEVMAHAMAYRAVALARIGEFDAARTQIAEALAAAPHAGSPVKEADVHIAVGMAYYDMGEVDKGLEHERIGAQKAYEAHGLECACAGAFGVGRGHHQQGELDAALSQYGRSLEIAERVGVAEFGPFMNMIDGSVALAEFERGSPAAIERLRRARENAHGAHDEFGAAALSQQLAGALMTLGRHAEAEPLLDEAMRYYRPRGMRPYLIGALKQAGQLSEAAGRSEEARRWREEAADLQAGLHAPRAA